MANTIYELEILLTPQRGVIQKLTESEIEAIKSAIKALSLMENVDDANLEATRKIFSNTEV